MNVSALFGSSASRRSRRRLVSALASGLLVGTVAGLVPLATPASAVSLYAHESGPVDNATGYPFWFGDSTGTRLELCLDDQQDPLCPVVGDRASETESLSVPENFPDESFWWAADAIIDTGTVRARLVLAQEAAFGGPGDVAVGQQVAFSRLRIRIDDLTPGMTYRVTTPYGAQDVVADDRGRVFETNDQGCLAPPCDFAAGLSGQIGPFLTWDGNEAPEGYVGDPSVEHTVTGSPTGDNLFRVVGPGIGGAGIDSIETDLFAVQGRIAQPRATVSEPGDLYLTGTPIEITSSFPGESTIFYTLDGSDPTTSPTRIAYAEPYALPEGPTTLRFAVEYNGAFSEVYREQYTARADVSIVSATPAPAVAPAVLEGRQDVALTASTTTVAADGTVTDLPTSGDIYYTTNGTRPRLDESGTPVGATRKYTDPIAITRTTMVKALSVPTAGESGPVGRFHYVIHNLRTVSPVGEYGYPTSLMDIGLAGATPSDPRVEPVDLELCLDDPLCPVVGELPDPTRGISFPDNFPDESFWWSGEAAMVDAAGERLRLVLAAEAAFDSPTVQDEHQVAFGRIRVRYDGAVPGATYEIVHPYGVLRASADDTGRLFYTDDNGCMSGPCGDFKALLTQPVGPFLRWATGAPAGYVGDPTIEHTVVGSPYGTNEFTVRQVTTGNGTAISPVLIGSTDQFAVQGMLAGGPGVMADFQTGTFNHPLQVTLTGNAATAEIRYTLDGSTPTASAGQVANGPITIPEGTTTLNYVGVGAGRTSLMETETYTVDTTAPTLSASPAGGEFTTAQNVALSANDSTAVIRYTLDGSTPTATSLSYTGPIRVTNSLTVKAMAVDPVGNASSVGSWGFTITPPTTDSGTDPTTTPPPTGGGGAGTTTTPPTGGTGATTTPPSGNAGPTHALTLRQGPRGRVDAGGTKTLRGVLAPNGQALVDVPIALQARATVANARLAAPGWVGVATARTTAGGGFAFLVEPSTTTEYRVVFNGDANHPAVTSAVITVKVKALVKLARPHRKVQRGDTLTFRGKLGPSLQGETVVVKLDGPGHRTDRVRATVNAQGRWRVTVRAPHKTGKWTVRAVWRGNGALLRDVSANRAFRVSASTMS